MKRGGIAGALLAVATWLAVANHLPAEAASGVSWSHPRTITASSGIRIAYPRAWTAFTTAPGSLVVASFAVPRDWPDRSRKRVPDGEVYMVIFTYGPAWKGYPAGRKPFELRPEERGFYACSLGLEGYRILFTDEGRAMQAMIALGRGSDGADALALLDRL